MICLRIRFVVHVGLNGSDIWVHKNNLETLLLKSLDGLSTGVVKLARLADGQAT